MAQARKYVTAIAPVLCALLAGACSIQATAGSFDATAGGTAEGSDASRLAPMSDGIDWDEPMRGGYDAPTLEDAQQQVAFPLRSPGITGELKRIMVSTWHADPADRSVVFSYDVPVSGRVLVLVKRKAGPEPEWDEYVAGRNARLPGTARILSVRGSRALVTEYGSEGRIRWSSGDTAFELFTRSVGGDEALALAHTV